jgi:hypothetical protein
MALQNLVHQLFIDGAWTAYKAMEAESTEVSIGPDDESGTEPSKAVFAWDNDTLQMDPYNPMSPLYGKIGQSTPARILVDGITLSQVEATIWDPDRTEEHTAGSGRGRSVTTFEGQGLLSRLGLWTDTVADPMQRQVLSYASLLGFWTLQGGNTDTTRLTEASGRATPGTVTGTVTMAGDDGPGGGDKCIQLGTNAQISGRFSFSTAPGWQAVFHAKLPAVPGSATYGTLCRFRLSNGDTIVWQINDTSYRILVTASDGTALMSNVIGRGAVDITQYVRHRLKATIAAGTVTLEYAWYQQDAPVIFGGTGTYARTAVGSLSTWDALQMGYSNGAGYCQVYAVTDTTLDLTGSYDAVSSFNGYLGEAAGNRYLRLMREQGLTSYMVGAASDTVRMGRQRPAIFTDLLEEVLRTDDAVIYDEPNDIGLTMVTRVALYSQTVQLAIDRTDCKAPLKRLADKSGLANNITVHNYDDTASVAVDAVSPLSILPPPAGMGVLKKTIEVNQANADQLLDDRAAWELNKGVTDKPRYRTIILNLTEGNPTVVTAASHLRPGDLITLTGAEYDTVRLHLVKVVHKVGAKERTATLTCRQADAWTDGAYDDPAARYDVAQQTTTATATTTATTISTVTPVAGTVDTWSQTAVPYDIMITGERMTVTAASAPASGAQTLTVTRSVNGVVKTHAVGEPIRLFAPIRYMYG